MKINFLSSKTYVGSKTKEAKIRKLSISKDRIMTISVDNLKWMDRKKVRGSKDRNSRR